MWWGQICKAVVSIKQLNTHEVLWKVIHMENSIDIAIMIYIITVDLLVFLKLKGCFICEVFPSLSAVFHSRLTSNLSIGLCSKRWPPETLSIRLLALWVPVGSGHCRDSTGAWREEEKQEQCIFQRTAPCQPCSSCLPQPRSLLLLKEVSSPQISLFLGLRPSLGC